MKSEVPPHLRPGTLSGWLRVLKREGRRETLRGKLHLVWTILKAAMRVGGVSKEQWRQRMETCSNCPIYDPELFRCRAYDGSEFGCGCAVKFQALVRNPYSKGCWAKQYLPDSGLGWE